MKGIFLLLGSNLGEREDNIFLARKLMEEKAGLIVNQSKIYETASWGVENEPDYLNQVIKLSSTKLPEELLVVINSIEKEIGRVRFEKWHSRIIDIDILFYDDQIIKNPTLTIPHPEIKNRLFTLIPLSEIAGEEVYPGDTFTIKDLISSCKDKLKVKEYFSQKKSRL